MTLDEAGPEEASQGDEPDVEIPLRVPAFWSARLLTVLGGAGLVWIATLVTWLDDAGGALSPFQASLVLGVPVAALALVALHRALTRPRQGPVIRLQAERLLLPRGADTGRRVAIAYRDILSLDLRGRPGREQVFIGCRRHLIVYPLRAFAEPSAAALLGTELRRRIGALPDGPFLLEQMDRRSSVARGALARRPLATAGLVVALALCFAVQQLSGAGAEIFGLVRLGANAPVLVQAGQLDRLISASFLHANFLHFYMNALALAVLGALLELLLGRERLLLLYFGSALCGGAASAAVHQAAYSVGASTAVFGLLGALAALNGRFRGELPGGFRQPLRWWAFILGLNALLPTLVPQVDVAAHVGGFIGGAIGALALAARGGVQRLLQPAGKATRGAAWMSVAVAALCLALSWSRGAGEGGEHLRRVGLAWIQDAYDPASLDAVAWRLIEGPSVPPANLQLAEAAARRALALQPDRPSSEVLLARTLVGQGQLDAALEAQRRAVAREPTSARVADLGRLLAQRLEATGPSVLGAPNVSAEAVRLLVEPWESVLGHKRAVRLEVFRVFPQGLEVLALVVRDGRRVGLLHAALGPGHLGEYRLVPDGQPIFNDWLGPFELEVALLDGRGSELEAGAWRWRYWSRDEMKED